MEIGHVSFYKGARIAENPLDLKINYKNTTFIFQAGHLTIRKTN